MAYRIEVKRNARKALLALPQVYRARIGEAVETLANNPRQSGTRKLEGSDRLYRLRIGDYRVVYEIHDDRLIVVVIKVGHRREVYRDH
jgi:mRNA interferase RelE/StbE